VALAKGSADRTRTAAINAHCVLARSDHRLTAASRSTSGGESMIPAGVKDGPRRSLDFTDLVALFL
jgi:hypothetical protein